MRPKEDSVVSVQLVKQVVPTVKLVLIRILPHTRPFSETTCLLLSKLTISSSCRPRTPISTSTFEGLTAQAVAAGSLRTLTQQEVAMLVPAVPSCLRPPGLLSSPSEIR